MSSKSDEDRLAGIESLRGVAALMILIFHVVELMKVPVPAALSFVSSHFGLGVPLFFSLSGFVLGYGYADKLAQGTRGAIGAFYIRRPFRIAPLFYVMLLAWLLVDWLLWGKVFSSQTLFFNITFLFGLVPGEHESIVWAGWSIGIEMLFYLLFPIFAVLLATTRRAVIGFVVACVVSSAVNRALAEHGMGTFAYMNLLTHLPFFFAGIGSFRIWQDYGLGKHRIGWLLLGASLCCVVLLANGAVSAALESLRFGAAPRNAWAIAFSMLLLSACLVANPVLEKGPLRFLGKLSFSLYLLHPMILVALIKADFLLHLTSMGLGAGLTFFMAATFVVGLVTAISALAFRFIEEPGIRLGRKFAVRASL
jgi:peptidoglycan/LPS O-acetylase OafA/YrhL